MQRNKSAGRRGLRLCRCGFQLPSPEAAVFCRNCRVLQRWCVELSERSYRGKPVQIFFVFCICVHRFEAILYNRQSVLLSERQLVLPRGIGCILLEFYRPNQFFIQKFFLFLLKLVIKQRTDWLGQ